MNSPLIKVLKNSVHQRIYLNPHIVFFASMLAGLIVGIMCGLGGAL